MATEGGMTLPAGIWTTSSPLSSEEVARWRPVLERAAAQGLTEAVERSTRWQWQPLRAEIDRDPEELPDDAIVPDETPPNPPDDIKTDAVPEDDPTTSPVDPEEGS